MRVLQMNLRYCRECPYCRFGANDKLRCEKTSKEIPTAGGIPKWCPLPEHD